MTRRLSSLLLCLVLTTAALSGMGALTVNADDGNNPLSTPWVDANGPYLADEGGSIIMAFTATSSPDLNLYRWDIQSDGYWEINWNNNPVYFHVFLDQGDNNHFVATVEACHSSAMDITYSDTSDVFIENVPPTAAASGPSVAYIGLPFTVTGHSTDPGSDDLEFTWDWGDWTSDSQMYLNDPSVGPDPYPSLEINPRDVTDTQDHIYWVPGIYTVTLTVEDDDGYLGIATLEITVAGLQVEVNIDPDTLNLKSKGKWITCYIDLPGAYDVNDIDITTILLEDTIPAEWGDVQGTTLMIKFDRGDVEDMLSPGTYNIKVTGELTDGTSFEGYSDEITVINPP